MSFKTYRPIPIELVRFARCKNCRNWKPARPRAEAWAGECRAEYGVLVEARHACAAWQALPTEVA